MQANVQVEQFRNALNKILSVVDKKSKRPILTYTLVTVKDDTLQIMATDSEVSAKIVIEANVEAQGTFCINAKNIFEILRELPDDTISLGIADNENSLKLHCQDIRYSLLILKSDDYPHLNFENESSKFNIDTNNLLDIINKTSHAICNDETRQQLNGLFLQESDGKLRSVATDGYRLSLIEFSLDNLNNEFLKSGIIIPKKGVYEIKKIVDSYPESSIDISVDESFIYINYKNQYFLSIRLIAKQYPPYQRVIPNKTTFKMNVDKTAFLNAVKRIKIMSVEKTNGVKIHLTPTEMKITANHPSMGDALEIVPATFDGEELEIGFNAKFLLDTLATFDDGQICVELNNQLTPIILKSDNAPDYLSLVMPLRLQY